MAETGGATGGFRCCRAGGCGLRNCFLYLLMYMELELPPSYQYLRRHWFALLVSAPGPTRAVAAFERHSDCAVLYLWVSREWGRDTAFWAAFWLAICPWCLVFSRWAQQGITVPLWMVPSHSGCSPKDVRPRRKRARPRSLVDGRRLFRRAGFLFLCRGEALCPSVAPGAGGSLPWTLRSNWRAFAPAAILLFALALPVAREAATPPGGRALSAHFNS
jgi:hypothetical protein